MPPAPNFTVSQRSDRGDKDFFTLARRADRDIEASNHLQFLLNAFRRHCHCRPVCCGSFCPALFILMGVMREQWSSGLQ